MDEKESVKKKPSWYTPKNENELVKDIRDYSICWKCIHSVPKYPGGGCSWVEDKQMIDGQIGTSVVLPVGNLGEVEDSIITFKCPQFKYDLGIRRMKILDIYFDSIVDGDGLRNVLFMAGCPHRCVGCHNRESWDIRNGESHSIQWIVEQLISSENNITISGGEPFFQYKELEILLRMIKKFSEKNIWVYTGFSWEEVRDLYPEIVQNIEAAFFFYTDRFLWLVFF